MHVRRNALMPPFVEHHCDYACSNMCISSESPPVGSVHAHVGRTAGHERDMHRVYCRYMGTEGVYTHTVAYERDAACPMCSAGVPFSVRSSDTLQQACAPGRPCLAAAVQRKGWLSRCSLVRGGTARRMHGTASGVTCNSGGEAWLTCSPQGAVTLRLLQCGWCLDFSAKPSLLKS